MTVTGPDFITLQARDVEAAAAFYETQLGLRRAPASPPGAVVFATTPIPFAIREPLPGVNLDAGRTTGPCPPTSTHCGSRPVAGRPPRAGPAIRMGAPGQTPPACPSSWWHDASGNNREDSRDVRSCRVAGGPPGSRSIEKWPNSPQSRDQFIERCLRAFRLTLAHQPAQARIARSGAERDPVQHHLDPARHDIHDLRRMDAAVRRANAPDALSAGLIPDVAPQRNTVPRDEGQLHQRRRRPGQIPVEHPGDIVAVE